MTGRATLVVSPCGSFSCARWLLSPLAVAFAVFITQTCKEFAHAADANGIEMSIDEAIMESFQSANVTGRMNDPSVVRMELDMLFTADFWQSMLRKSNSTRRLRRKALRNETFRWPNAEVPYILDASFNPREVEMLNQAIAEYHGLTCIRFRQKRQNDSDYIRIVGDGGCSSYVGRIGGEQEVWLQPLCRKKSIILHELGHALGFVHEHARPDRDDYVVIYKQNVELQYENDFAIYSPNDVVDGGIGYDYLSIMHFGQYMASRNRQRVIETKDPRYQTVIGKGKGLSFGDAKLANMVYRCAERKRCRKKSCPGEGFVGHDCRCWCPTNSTGTAAAAHCPGCLDYDAFCSIYSRRGFCTKRFFMKVVNDLCPRSCGRCE